MCGTGQLWCEATEARVHVGQRPTRRDPAATPPAICALPARGQSTTKTSAPLHDARRSVEFSSKSEKYMYILCFGIYLAVPSRMLCVRRLKSNSLRVRCFGLRVKSSFVCQKGLSTRDESKSSKTHRAMRGCLLVSTPLDILYIGSLCLV